MEYVLKEYPDWYEIIYFPYGIPDGNKKTIAHMIKDKQNSINASISRAKRMIREYAMCNDFKYFVTWTLTQEMTPKEFKKKLSKKIVDYNSNHKTKIKYLYVFEWGDKTNRLHAHGIMTDVPNLYYNGKYSRKKDTYGMPYMSSTLFDDLGFQGIELIRNHDRIGSYLCKYLMKDIVANRFEGQRYMCSKGLNRPIEVASGILDNNNIKWDYEGKYVWKKKIDKTIDLSKLLELSSNIDIIT